MDFDKVISYYSKPMVASEISTFSKDRWLAIHTMGRKRLFIRYFSRGKKPLKITGSKGIKYLLYKFQGLRPRTFYGSVNLYKNLEDPLELDNPNNIYRSTPTWDIDGSIDFWDKIVDLAHVIINELEKFGIYKSVYLKWSGRGIHIHIHENSISEDALKNHHPLDLSYAVVDFILSQTKDKVREIIRTTPSGERPLKIENEIDMKRVFTTPLSLHKQLDYSAICLKPDDLDNFDLSWADPWNFRHNKDWVKYVEGEADDLALRALDEAGGYFKRVGGIRTIIEGYKRGSGKTGKKRMLKAKVGRFQVMALLQAARYYVLKGDLEKAKSFGLNRAIFYAWAKYHGRYKKPRKPAYPPFKKEEHRKEFKIGNEVIFISDNGWFIIGDKEQSPEDYDKEVVYKISSLTAYEKAWKKAVEYIKHFSKETLLDQQEFYDKVYKPIRDAFFEK